MKIAVIPARGGSKRIPRKNIKLFCGKPMIAYSIQAALESECFDRIVVSTDDAEIAEVALKWGAEVPFMRPESLSGDFVGTIPVIKHAIETLSQDKPVTAACCIYATAPFVRASDIQQGAALLAKHQSSFAFSVTSYPFPIQRAIKIHDHQVEMFQPELFEQRSQDLEEAFHDAGQFYWGTADAWMKEAKIFAPHSVPVILPRYRVQDIDTPEDWVCAELMFDAINRLERT